jgi:hypothetical protein
MRVRVGVGSPRLSNWAHWRHLSGVPRYEPGYQYQSQSPISPGLVHPLPLRPMPNIQWGTTSGGWRSPLYTPFYAQPYEWPQVSNQGPLQTMQHPSPLICLFASFPATYATYEQSERAIAGLALTFPTCLSCVLADLPLKIITCVCGMTENHSLTLTLRRPGFRIVSSLS